jgi:hypothetical protein
MSDTIDDVRKALTGWWEGKSQASGKGGDRRQKTIDDAVDDAVNGDRDKPVNAGPGAQSTDAQNRY